MSRTLALICVPSSAGAHWPGQEKAPQFLREAGLVERLQKAGLRVTDDGDLPRVRFRPDAENRRQKSLRSVVEVARLVSERVAEALEQSSIPLIIGGDCTISLGVLAGFARAGADVGLLYFDGHTDLNTPATTPSGILDGMGVAHMIGEPGAAEELSLIGPRFPLLPADKLVLFGYNPRESNETEQEVSARHRLLGYPLADVQRDVRAAAAEALAQIERRAERFVIHFDVDVMDFTDFPIANVPQFTGGLSFKDTFTCLRIFTASAKFCGLIVTEINPDHADEEGALAERFVNGLAEVLAESSLQA